MRRYPSLCALLPACSRLKVRRACDRGHAELFVFLPGIGDVPEDFEVNGFERALQESRKASDVVVPDLHFGYYVRRSMLERLREDVIVPARDCYDAISLVGISLGGFGALVYAMEHDRRAQRLVLLAPYLGESALVREIETAGGVKAWEPGTVHVDDFARRLWFWLKECARVPAASILAHTYLGFAEGDPFARANALLAAILPDRNVFKVSGGHDWKTWQRLWQLFLAT